MKGLLAVWIAVLVGAAGWIGWDAWQGKQPSIGGPFTLTDQNGKSFSSESLKGKPTLIYFGYAFCPDVCPTSLLLMETAIEQLGPDTAKKVNLVFITVDPERDTPEVMKAYMGAFDPAFVALIPSPEQLTAVAKDFKVYYKKVEGKTPGSYTMDHSAASFVYDPEGRLRLYARYGAGPQVLADDLKQLLQA